jgi:hypothetical protein
MNCTKCKELLIAYVEGLLDESPKQTVAEHLKDCPACRTEADELTALQERLVRNGKALAQSDLENNVMNKIVREQNVRLKAAHRATEALKTRRTLMKSPMTKIAAAAVILIAVVLIGINPFGGTVTFAQVVEPILNAKTVILDLIIGSDESGPSMHEIVVGSRIRRMMSSMPNMIQILDLDGGRILALDEEEKSAAYVDIQGAVAEGTKNYVEFLRQVIQQVQNGQVEKIGEKVIDGQKVIGFVGRGPNEKVTIWADPKTAHPIRIEIEAGQMVAMMKNFEFDAPVDEALVSMDVPAGYQLKDTTFNLKEGTEQDFIEGLRIWTEVLGDGTFPDAVGSEITMRGMPEFVQKLQQLPISEEEGTEMAMQVARGMLFHQMLDIRGGQWHYAGAGVKLGAAQTPIFWYQPQGSPTCRVIYGDLSVKDVAPENLPE